MANKTLQVELVERIFKNKEGKEIKYNALVIRVKTLDGTKEVALTATNKTDKFYLKEYLKSVK
jgi:hypothetical protein